MRVKLIHYLLADDVPCASSTSLLIIHSHIPPPSFSLLIPVTCARYTQSSTKLFHRLKIIEYVYRIILRTLSIDLSIIENVYLNYGIRNFQIVSTRILKFEIHITSIFLANKFSCDILFLLFTSY